MEYMCEGSVMYMRAGAYRVQKMVSDPLETELQEVASHLSRVLGELFCKYSMHS